MKRSIRESLEASTECLEYIVKRWDDLPLQEKIDIAARLKGISKHCKFIDDSTKELVATKLGGGEGTVIGEVFKSVRRWIPKRLFSQTLCKEQDPDVYEKYMQDGGNYEVRYEPR